MNSREEVLRQFAAEPVRWADYTLALHQQLAEHKQLLSQREEMLRQAQQVIAGLKLQLFGPKSDKLTPEQEGQLQELSGDLQDQAQRPPALSQDLLQEEQQLNRQRTQRRRRHFTPVQLETQRIVLEPPEEEKSCEHCHKAKKKIGEEISTEYDLIPAKLICRQTVRPKYGSACQCGGGVSIAPLPLRLLPQSKLGLGLAVHILLCRFDDHLAYYTLERIFQERHGINIPRQQMVQWVEKIAFLLLAIYHLIWEEMKAGDYLQIDETPVKVLDPEVKGKAATGYLWFYSVPGGDALLEFSQSRGQEAPRKRLTGFEGTIQSDGYEVYNALKRERPGTLKRIGCLAHARRKFYKAVAESSREAIWFIGQIRLLYRLEDKLREASPGERKAARLKTAPPIWLAMKRRAETLRAAATFLPQSTLGKAVRYFLNEYTAMVGYLRDGRFEIDNNLVENDIRPEAVGRRRWLFIGHPDAGWRSAVIYTIILSCRRRGINPQKYLSDVLERLPSMTSSQVKELLPSRWKPRAADSS
jgi:transposase